MTFNVKEWFKKFETETCEDFDNVAMAIHCDELLILDRQPDGSFVRQSSSWKDYPFSELDGHSIAVVESVGGEGEGDHCHMVVAIVELATGKAVGYMKIDGWYASYDGFHYEDEEWYQVEPREVTVTQFFKV